MIRRVILAVAVLAGLTGAIAVSAGMVATPAAACDEHHTT